MGDGSANNSTTPGMQPATSNSSPYTITTCVHGLESNSGEAWKAFDQEPAYGDRWCSSNCTYGQHTEYKPEEFLPSTWSTDPSNIMIDLGEGNEKCFDKFTYSRSEWDCEYFEIHAFILQGSNVSGVAVTDAIDSSNWDELYSWNMQDWVAPPPDYPNDPHHYVYGENNWYPFHTFINNTAYRYYRICVRSEWNFSNGTGFAVQEFMFVEESITEITTYEVESTGTTLSFDSVSGYVLYDVNATESNSNSDTVSEYVIDVTIDITETEAPSDSINGYVTHTANEIEATSNSDAVTIGYRYQDVITESLFVWETIKTGWHSIASESLVLADIAGSPVLAKIDEWLAINEDITANGIYSLTTIDAMILASAIHAAKVRDEAIAEEFTITESILVKTAFIVQEFLQLSETLSGTGAFPKEISETLTLADEIIFPVIELAILESLGFSGAVSAILGVIGLSANDSLALTDDARSAWFEIIQDLLAAVDTASVVTLLKESISDTLDETDDITETRSTYPSIFESMTLAETITANASLYQVVYDALALDLSIVLGDEVYECWVLNTGKFYPSLYSGFDFNSYATFEGRNYGANSTGIFELTGATDNGATIHAGLELPETHFGVPNQKRFLKGFVGISGTRPVMQVETENGELKTYDIDSDGEIDMTRDMKSKSWKLRIGDFESLDFIKLFPVVLAK